MPAYNAHSTIVAAISSILTQTLLKDIKLTIIDDCSEKDYLSLLEPFSSFLNYEIIRLKENQGPGTCRKIGLEKTNGDYVMFMDADDVFLTPKAVELLYNAIIEKKAHVVTGSFLEETKEGKIVRHEVDLVWVFAKIYSREFLNRKKITFNNSRANEDAGFNYLIRLCTDRIHHIKMDVYLWRYHPNAITKINNNSYSFNESLFGLLYNRHWAFKEAIKRNALEEKTIPMMTETLILFYSTYIKMLYKNKDKREEYFNRLKEFYKEIIAEYGEKISLKQIEEKWSYMYRNSNECKISTMYIPDITFFDFLKKLAK